jgi:hypothetical protein
VTDRRSLRETIDAAVGRARDAGADEDAIADAFAAATRSSAQVVAVELRKRSRRMLTEHRRLRKGFEHRLYEHWRAALDLYYSVLVCSVEAGEAFHSRHSADDIRSADPKFQAMSLLHARACSVGSEIFALLRTGHPAGGQARSRTLHELAVIAVVLGDADLEVSERFLLHRFVDNYRDACAFQESCEALGYEPLTAAEFADVKRLRDDVVARYGSRYARDWGWAQPLLASSVAPSFIALEQLAGLDHFRPHYRLGNHAVHAGAKGATDTVELYGQGVVLLAGTTNAGLADPGIGALKSLVQVSAAYLCNACFPDSPEIEDLIALEAMLHLVTNAEEAFLEADRRMDQLVMEARSTRPDESDGSCSENV